MTLHHDSEPSSPDQLLKAPLINKCVLKSSSEAAALRRNCQTGEGQREAALRPEP